MSSYKRIPSLDYLRGYAAALIMVYHYMSWSGQENFFHFFLGKIGFYGVEVFYILSGYTLAHVYNSSNLRSPAALKRFYIKRFFRIFPLLWLVIILTIVLRAEGLPDIDVLIINITGLFSVYRIDEYIALGSWSIGNELFFYLIFPVLMIAKKKSLVIVLSILIFGAFVFFLLPDMRPLTLTGFEWKGYINPLNHLAFFYVGILLFRAQIQWSKVLSLTMIAIVLLLLTFMPYTERNEVVFGFERLYYGLGMCSIVIALVSIPRYTNEFLHRVSEHLGKISYSVYLLHPLVWGGLGFILNRVNFDGFTYLTSMRIIISIVASLVMSSYVYKWLEVRFVSIGKTLVNR